ncbi:MAG: Ig-like domain-containing protein, partial [Candidatus Poribacteria bacterium]|nr:Ig-like domain-containing protein [Candidatus Poribacteria bacterium]
TLEFTDTERIDFENTSVTLRGADGQEIPVTLVETEDDTLMVRFVPLTQSGEYTLSVTPQDIAGNAAQGSVQYPFRLKFEVPSLASVKANTPDATFDLIPYEIVEISEFVNGFTLEFTDTERVDFANTRIVLTGPNGQEISVTSVETEDDTLMVRFVPLTQSGAYTLSVTPQDIAGNVAQGSVQYPFRLKFEVPGLASVKINTTGTPIELIMHEIVEISETFSSLILEFTDASRIDFDNTDITLTGPNGQEIAITLQDYDDSQLMVRFIALTQSGIYTFAVTPQDKAGNVAQRAIQYQFRLDTTLPSVSSIMVDGKRGSTVYVRNAIPRIIATITDSIGIGVAFGDSGSTIVVTNSQGIQISGTTTSNGENQLTWIPTPLPTDGTADGQYTVAVTPVDRAGRNGTTVHRQFIYDTQAPRIVSATPLTLHAPVSYVSELSEFVLTIEDVGPANLVFASQVVALIDATGKPVPAVLTYDELTQQLYLTLTKPFASDGSADGSYTLNALLIDKAGNTLNSRLALVYDSKVPQVSSVQVNTPGAPTELVINEVPDLSETIDTITIQFSEATRIDFENTSVSLTDPDNLTIPLTQGDDGVSQLTLSFTELTKIGQYTLQVTPQDVAGNAVQSPIQFAFNLLFILPGVDSVRIGDTVTLDSGDIAYVNADNLVIVVNLLDPAGVGLSFDSITGSEILVATLDNQIVPGRIATNETDVIAWSPSTLSSDGSSDGRYAVYIYPVDKKGREGNTIYREFIYDTQEPEITEATPINLSQPISYISESLTQFQFSVQDVGPADLTLEDQEVRLRNQSGTLIPTKLTNDTNNRLFLTLDEPLPLDGSRDGEYTVEIAFSDKAGNILSINHPIVYDTQAPTLVSTVPAHGAQLTEDVTQIEIVLDDKGESGIDWSRTTVTLVNPDGVEISGELTSNGKTQMTLTTNQLVADGMYIMRVQAIDRAGNGSQSIFERSFLLSRPLPAVLSTSPKTAPIEDAYTNEEVEQIEVMLETTDESHLSTVRLLNSNNQVISGQQLRQPDKLIYKLVRPLATDGSEDGIYTIEFTPISATGRSGEVQQLSFTYDTQPPELITKGVQLIVAEAQVNNSLTQIRLNLTDNVAGIDWENLDEDWVTFERLSPNPSEITGSVSYVADEQSYIIFDLKVPLADDGSNDGKYRVTVTPIDKAGNGDETYEEEFTYDTSPPVIDPNSLLINDTPLLTDIDAEDYPSAISSTGGVTIQASVSDTGLGVNLSLSSISIRNPNGQEIPGTTRRNGVDTILFTSDGLNVEGNYQVMVTAVGNDTEQLGFSPNSSITTAFLYETTDPTAVVTNDGGKTEFTDEELTLEGTAADPQGVRRAGPQGENEVPVPASGVWLVEIVGTGPDGQPIEPVLATDESNAQQQPWSRWSIDFLPARSGEYDLDIRVTDTAGNYAVYDVGEYTMSVSFSFQGNTFVYPNPVRHSKGDSAFISFDLNAAAEEQVELTLYIYDWSGDLVYTNTYTNIIPGERNDTHINWKLKNQAGTPVARGLYVFRLEAVNGAGNRANSVGKILVVD